MVSAECTVPLSSGQLSCYQLCHLLVTLGKLIWVCILILKKWELLFHKVTVGIKDHNVGTRTPSLWHSTNVTSPLLFGISSKGLPSLA